MSKETKKAMLSDANGEIEGSKIVGNNTIEIKYADGRTAIRLHHTDVVTKYPDGSIALSSGGWRTPTTRDRIKNYSPIIVWTDNRVWYCRMRGEHDKDYAFYDGITFEADGSLRGEPLQVDLKAIRKLKRQIKKFVDLLDAGIPDPGPGDCWYCCMRDKDGVPWGAHSKDNTHLLEHVKEGYMNGSLVVNAMRNNGYRDDQVQRTPWFPRDTVKRVVRRYLSERLIEGMTAQRLHGWPSY